MMDLSSINIVSLIERLTNSRLYDLYHLDKTEKELQDAKTLPLPEISDATVRLFKIPQRVLEIVSKFRDMQGKTSIGF